MKENCNHKYTLISDDRSVEKHRYTSTYKRTLRFFCEKCLDIKEKHEMEDSDKAVRSGWTYNIE